MKKLLSLMFVAGLAATGLVACGGNETPTEKPATGNTETPTTENTESPTTSGEKTEIKIWLDQDAYANAIIPAIEAAIPNVKMIYENVGAAESHTKLELDGPAGFGADIFIQPHDTMGPSIEGNILLPVGADLIANMTDRMLESSVNTTKSGDNYFGVPLSTESIALFYNKTLLEENGLTVATSFEEIIEQGRVYNDVKQNKFIFRFQSGNAYDSHFFLTANGFQIYGPEGNDPSLVNLDSQEVINGLTSFAAMKEVLPVPYGDLNWDTVHGEFVNGNVPYIITGPWSISEIKDGAETNGFEWGVTSIPTINGVQPESFSGNIITVISAYTKHPDLARQVVEFMVSEEGLQILYDTTGKIPALKDASVISGIDTDPYIQGILAQAAFSEAMPTISDFNKYWGPAETMFRSVWDGIATPEEAAAKALADYNNALLLSE